MKTMEQKGLTLNEYQHEAIKTSMPTCNNPGYMMNKLIAEIGEFAGKIAKGIRDGEYTLNKNHVEYRKEENMAKLCRRVDEEKELQKKLGEVLWHLSGTCTAFGWSFEEIAKQNLMEREIMQIDRGEQNKL